ncbi:MAG: 5'-nucleotidase C-terminal domain-containing protein [Bacteroidales bacterium]|nr:5'-nucleotidase C-terminal domain-containing protein [Bacteroidales bacterium]
MVRNHRLFFSLLISIIVFLPACRHKDLPREVGGELILLDSLNVPVPDPGIESSLAFYREEFAREMNQVVAYSPFAMRRASPEGLLNNFVSDLVLEVANELYEPENGKGIDFCLLNYGGLRASLPAGEITRSNVFELMPFENEMVVLTLSGEKTLQLFEYVAGSDRGMPIAGLKIGIKDGELGHVLIGGQAFDPDRNYKVVTSDYLAEGGDRMRFFLDPINTEVLGMRIRDAILMYMERETASGNELHAELDGRIYFMD